MTAKPLNDLLNWRYPARNRHRRNLARANKHLWANAGAAWNAGHWTVVLDSQV